MNEKIATQDLLLNIATAEGAVLARFEEAKKQLKEFRGALPDLYAKSFLREITNGELCEAKRQIAMYQEVVETTPVMLEGLARRKESLQKSEAADRKRERKAKALERYKTLKAEMDASESYDRLLETGLFTASLDCGKRGEAEEIVKEWKRKIEGTPTDRLSTAVN